MLEKLTIKSRNNFNRPGDLCESLIFYQNTNLILDPGSLPEALAYCGYDNLNELLRSGELSLNFSNQAFGAGNVEGNKFIISTFTSDAQRKTLSIQKSVESIYGRNIKSQNITKHLNRVIGYHHYSDKYQNLSKRELSNEDNLLSAITILTKGEFNRENVKLTIEEAERGLYNIESNIDNEVIRDSAHLISTGVAQIYDAEMNNSSLIGNYKVSNYAENKINKIIQRRKADEDQINAFHQFVLPEYYDLQGTINSGSKEFNEFMELWREAIKFKSWLKDEEPTVELLTAYIRKISEKTWLDKLPSKNVRWLLFAGIGTLLGGEIGGAAGTAASLGVDYLDDLILNRLLNNWKPDQYIQGDYKDFLNLRIGE